MTGHRHSQATKAKISAAKLKKAREADERFPLPLRGTKRCPRCQEWKIYDIQDRSRSEYGIERRRYKDGTFAFTPVSKCKSCHNRWYREKYYAEMSEEKRRARVCWNPTPEYRKRRNQYERERYAIKRDMLGKPVLNGKKQKEKAIYVDPRAMLDWIDELPERITYLETVWPSEARAVRRARDEGRIRLAIVDRIFTRFGAPEEFVGRYPPVRT